MLFKAQRMKIVSSFANPHVVPNLHDFLVPFDLRSIKNKSIIENKLTQIYTSKVNL